MKDVKCSKCGCVLQIQNSHVNYRCPVCRGETVIDQEKPINEACYTHVKENEQPREVNGACLVTLTDETLTEHSVAGFDVFEIRTDAYHVSYLIRKPDEDDKNFAFRIWYEAFERNLDDGQAVYIGMKAAIIDKLQGVTV